MQRIATSSGQIAEGCLWHTWPQLNLHLEGFHSNGNGSEEQDGHLGFEATGQVEVDRKLAKFSKPEQHTDGIAHAHHQRGKSRNVFRCRSRSAAKFEVRFDGGTGVEPYWIR